MQVLDGFMIFGHEIKASIADAASQCETTCYIAIAYCKKTAFEELFINPSIKAKVKLLFLRWQLSDLVSGASDLDVYPLAKKYGWTVYIHQKLHAKVYRFDNDCFVGSANLTNMGMIGEPLTSNIEALSKEKVDKDIDNWFLQLINNSRELDDELFYEISNDVEKYTDIIIELNNIKYSSYTQNLFNKDKIENLYTHDFFWIEHPDNLFSPSKNDNRNVEHDLQLLRLNPPISSQDVSNSFHQSKAFHWLLNILLKKKVIYFGELTALLHDELQDDPAPYRMTVKMLLNNLINWAGYYSQDLFIIDQPNISTRLKLRN